jgi:hypothetical protein
MERVGVGYHFALGQELLRDKEYRQYYMALGRLGHFIMVDNGAAEQDVPDFKKVVWLANKCNAAEIVLPDVLGDWQSTVELLTDEVLDLVPSRKRMIVPQGETLDEWFLCFEHQLKRTKYCIESIGIAKHHEGRWEGGRAAILQRLVRDYPSIPQNIHIHLLGVFLDPFQEMSAAASICDIRGIDSGMPVAWAQRYLTLAPEVTVEDHLGMEWNAEWTNEDPHYLTRAKDNIWALVRYGSQLENYSMKGS